MATRKINESSNYFMSITDDGTDTGKTVGSMNATLNTGSPTINITASLTQVATLPADSVIQGQFTDFVAQVRKQAANIGLTQFGVESAAATPATEVSK